MDEVVGDALSNQYCYDDTVDSRNDNLAQHHSFKLRCQ